MTVKSLLNDLVWRYMWIGPYWKLFTYVITLVFSVMVVHIEKKQRFSVRKCFIIIFLFFYLITVYVSTVLARRHVSGELMNLHFFWSWRKMLFGDKNSFKLVVENIIMLSPIGFLMPFIIEKKYVYLKTVVLGFIFSLFIEVSQYFNKTGLFEIDDLFNNTLGVIIGALFIFGCLTIVNNIKRYNN